jgi:hypothetical protein
VTVEHPRQVVERLVAALMKLPASRRLPDRVESLVAGRRLNDTPKAPRRRRDNLGRNVLPRKSNFWSV